MYIFFFCLCCWKVFDVDTFKDIKDWSKAQGMNSSEVDKCKVYYKGMFLLLILLFIILFFFFFFCEGKFYSDSLTLRETGVSSGQVLKLSPEGVIPDSSDEFAIYVCLINELINIKCYLLIKYLFLIKCWKFFFF
jgi:hypothetical protein